MAKNETPKAKKAEKIDIKKVSQSTAKVSFKFSKGAKIDKTEVMSTNVAEILELKGLGKQVKK